MTTPVWARVLVVLVLAAFVGLGSLWIARPGLQYDETLFLMASRPRADTPIAYTMHFGDRPVALMIISYLGALKGWVYAPLLGTRPASPAGVRLPAMLIGAAGLAFLYLFARRAFGWQTALLALALASTDPVYLFTTRLDWGPVAIPRLCLLAGCFGVLRWWQKQRLRDLGLACFAFGLGVFDKATFLWMLVALAAAALLVFPRSLWRGIRSPALPVALAGLVIGSAGFLYYAWKWPGETFRHQTEPPEGYAEKLRGAQHILQGAVLVGWISRDVDGEPLAPPDPLARAVYAVAPRLPHARTLLLPAALAALLLLPALPFRPWGRGMLFTLLVCLIAFAQMLPVRSAGAAHHLALLLPFPQLFVAAGLLGARQGLLAWLSRPPWPRVTVAALGILAAALLAANLRGVAHHYFSILGYGGGPGWSEAIYPLERSLHNARPERIVLLDWGMTMQLRLLSGDRLPLVEAEQPQGASYNPRSIEIHLANPRAVFVQHAPGESSAFPQIAAAFHKLAAERGFETRVVETIRDGHGRPVYQILSLRKPARPPW